VITLRKLGLLVCVASVAACAGSAQIQSFRNPAWRGSLDRLVVVHEFATAVASSDRITGRSYAGAVEAKLRSELMARGVDALVLALPSDNAVEFVKAAIVKHGAQALLTFAYRGGVTNIAGHHYRADFDARIVDMHNQPVWHARIAWEPGGNVTSVDERASLFVSELMAALTRDGILRRKQEA
jgi:hypothetical protein